MRHPPDNEICEYCAQPLDPNHRVEVVVPDSAYLHPSDPREDGRRPTVACSRRHADKLIDRGEENWVDEELWARKFTRVSWYWNSDTTLDAIADLAGLSERQLRRMAEWRMRGH